MAPPPFVAMRACAPCYIGPNHRTVGKRMRRWEFIVLLSGEGAAPLAAALTAMRSLIFEGRKRHAPHRSHRHQSRRFGEGNQVL
jgi:hypothetical protein